ncbi:MAG TPA: nucleoside kinase [Candidatus Aphodocola excrementigallinarum]|uniref:Nucleoside kinase n=1 Tax=Candidatus Aphodocola excrementigallinarum TaxID=2840670 RepID=A0A9D1IR18_9FIRM|nr:nucleoside kinase [Candidatus Aphodocola excrementigallinarum]
MAMIKIKVNDKEYDYEKGTTLLEMSKKFQSEFKSDIIVALVNNKLMSLDTKITRNAKVVFKDATDVLGNRTYQRGLYYIFIKAVKDVLNCDVKIMHLVDNGVYCEILTNNLISEVTVEKIKIRMREIVEAKMPITKIIVSRLDAIEYYERVNQFDKANSMKFISNSSVSLYKLDDTLDYFYGVLPCNTSYITKFNVKYLKDNKVVLLPPYEFLKDEKLKFDKNEKLLSAISRNDEYLENLGINTSVELNNSISNASYGDIIRISETLQNNRLFEIADKITKNKDIKIVLITGPSSSGKTTTSKKLSLYLRCKGYEPIPISIDDFYTDMKDRVLDENGKPEIEKIEAFDTNQFNKKISCLLNGEEVILPKYNFVEGRQEFDEKSKVKMKDKSILIIEGIHAFNESLTEMIPDKNKFKLFICPLTPLNIDNHNLFKMTDNRLLRRIVRDNRTRGASASDTLRMWKKVRKIEEEFIMPYQKDADEVFNTSLVYELGVLKTYAEPLLFSVDDEDPNYDDAMLLINMFRVILGIPSDDVPNDSILREFIGESCFKVI